MHTRIGSWLSTVAGGRHLIITAVTTALLHRLSGLLLGLLLPTLLLVLPLLLLLLLLLGLLGVRATSRSVLPRLVVIRQPYLHQSLTSVTARHAGASPPSGQQSVHSRRWPLDMKQIMCELAFR